MDIHDKIKEFVGAVPIALFMKGDRQFPQCGFSGRAIQILEAYGVEFETVNVLLDDELRNGIKSYSSWPTVPQLYVNGEFVGGSDIMLELHESGELARIVGAAVHS